jgi:hypothetical protein
MPQDAGAVALRSIALVLVYDFLDLGTKPMPLRMGPVPWILAELKAELLKSRKWPISVNEVVQFGFHSLVFLLSDNAHLSVWTTRLIAWHREKPVNQLAPHIHNPTASHQMVEEFAKGGCRPCLLGP